jgi:hypothetical protein
MGKSFLQKVTCNLKWKMGMKPRVIGELPVTKQLQWQANCITKKFP